jgi:hypothetical protein
MSSPSGDATARALFSPVGCERCRYAANVRPFRYVTCSERSVIGKPFAATQRRRDSPKAGGPDFHQLEPIDGLGPSDRGFPICRVGDRPASGGASHACEEHRESVTQRVPDPRILFAPFDSLEPVQHPKEVLTLVRRAAAVVAVLTLFVGNVAVCAGWQATPEARMACCMNGATCPMHKSDRSQHSSTQVVTQAQADSCCAAGAQRSDSAAAGSTFAASGVMAVVPVAVLTFPVSTFASQEWRALVPLPVSSTPKHLLLSVFLV